MNKDKGQRRYALGLAPGLPADAHLLKVLAPFVQPYMFKLVWIFALLPLSAFLHSVQPLILQKAIDDLQAAALLNYVLAFAAAILLYTLLQIYLLRTINSFGQRIVADIRQRLFEHLESLSLSFFNRTPVGRSVTRVTSDMEQMADSFAGGLILTVIDLVNLLAVIGFMFFMNRKLTLLVLCFLVPMILLANYFQREYRKANLEARRLLSKLNSFLQQNVVGIAIVQMLNSVQKSMQIFEKSNQEYFAANDKTVKADAMFSASIEFISIAAIVALIYCSSLLIKMDLVVSVGVMIAFIQYTQSMFEPVRNLSDRFTIIQSGFTAAERVAQLLEEQPEINDPEQPVEIASLGDKIEIEFDDVWFAYGLASALPCNNDSDTEGVIASSTKQYDWVLQGLSFKISALEKIALVGKTGAGKSTIIKLLTRLYEPQRGSIKINGIDIRNFCQSDLRKLITVVHQDSYIFEGGLEANISLAREDADLARAMNFVRKIGFEHKLRPKEISAGEEQLINFARALASNAKVLVLDEASAKIDLKTEQAMQAEFKELIQDKTAIVIAHRIETTNICDRQLQI